MIRGREAYQPIGVVNMNPLDFNLEKAESPVSQPPLSITPCSSPPPCPSEERQGSSPRSPIEECSGGTILKVAAAVSAPPLKSTDATAEPFVVDKGCPAPPSDCEKEGEADPLKGASKNRIVNDNSVESDTPMDNSLVTASSEMPVAALADVAEPASVPPAAAAAESTSSSIPSTPRAESKTEAISPTPSTEPSSHTSSVQGREGCPGADNDSQRQSLSFETLPTPPLQITTKKRVSFNASVHYREIRHVNSYTPEEFNRIWMTAIEYHEIKQMVKLTVNKMMQGEIIPEEDSNFCTRGLEFRTKAGSRVRARNKLRARSAVLNEQDLQREEGFCDPQYIAMACMETSLECRQGARARALYDEKIALSYQMQAAEDLQTVKEEEDDDEDKKMPAVDLNVVNEVGVNVNSPPLPATTSRVAAAGEGTETTAVSLPPSDTSSG